MSLKADKVFIFSGFHAEAIGSTSNGGGDTMVTEMAAKISAMAAWPDPSSHWADVPGNHLQALFNTWIETLFWPCESDPLEELDPDPSGDLSYSFVP